MTWLLVLVLMIVSAIAGSVITAVLMLDMKKDKRWWDDV